MRTAACLVLCILAATSPVWAAGKLCVATPLTSIGASSDPDAPPDRDDPGAGGAFSGETYFTNRLTSKAAIAACAGNIETVAATWAGKHALTRAQRDLEPSSLTLHYIKPGLKGLFEVVYRVQLQVHARVTVNFYAQDGTALDPGAVGAFLTGYDIAKLEDDLRVALQCGGRAA